MNYSVDPEDEDIYEDGDYRPETQTPDYNDDEYDYYYMEGSEFLIKVD